MLAKSDFPGKSACKKKRKRFGFCEAGSLKTATDLWNGSLIKGIKPWSPVLAPKQLSRASSSQAQYSRAATAYASLRIRLSADSFSLQPSCDRAGSLAAGSLEVFFSPLAPDTVNPSLAQTGLSLLQVHSPSLSLQLAPTKVPTWGLLPPGSLP